MVIAPQFIRLTLRGSRRLQLCSICPPNPPKGHWSWVKCGYASRRLTVANDKHADRRLTTQVAIQAAAIECYHEAKVEGSNART
jgi:hypothetical protein